MSSSHTYYEPYEIVGPAQQITGISQVPPNRPVFVDHTKFRSVSFTAGQHLEEQNNSRRNNLYEKRPEILSNGMALPRTLMSKNSQTAILRPRSQTSPAYLVSQTNASIILPPSGLQTPPLTYLDSPLWSDASPRSSITSLASLGPSALSPNFFYEYDMAMQALSMDSHNLAKFGHADISSPQLASPRLDHDYSTMQKPSGIPPKLSLQIPSSKYPRPLSAISSSLYKTELNTMSPVLQNQSSVAPKRVQFDQVVTVARTWSSDEYDRTPIEVEPLTTNDLPGLSSAIIQYVFERDGFAHRGHGSHDSTKPPLSPVPTMQKPGQFYNSHPEPIHYVPQSPVSSNFLLDRYFTSGGIITGASTPRQLGEFGGTLSNPTDSLYQSNFPALHSPASPMKEDRFKTQLYRGPPESPISGPRSYAPPKGQHFSQNNQHHWKAADAAAVSAGHSQNNRNFNASKQTEPTAPRSFLVNANHGRDAAPQNRNINSGQRSGAMSRQSDTSSQLSISESDLQNDTSSKISVTGNSTNIAVNRVNNNTKETSVPHIRELLLPLQMMKVSPGVPEHVSSPVPQESQDEEAEIEDAPGTPEQHRRRRRRKRTRNRKKKTDEQEFSADQLSESVVGYNSIIRPEIAV